LPPDGANPANSGDKGDFQPGDRRVRAGDRAGFVSASRSCGLAAARPRSSARHSSRRRSNSSVGICEAQRSRPRIRKDLAGRAARPDPRSCLFRNSSRSALSALARETALVFRFATYPFLQTEMRRVLRCKLEPTSARSTGRHDCCTCGEVQLASASGGRDRLRIARGGHRTSAHGSNGGEQWISQSGYRRPFLWGSF
jgi:hypothetical protein